MKTKEVRKKAQPLRHTTVDFPFPTIVLTGTRTYLLCLSLLELRFRRVHFADTNFSSAHFLS